MNFFFDQNSFPALEDNFWQQFQFSPVVELPHHFEVYDFTQGYDPHRLRASEYGIGKYLEDRQGMYTEAQYQNSRTVHMGVDIAAPVQTPVKAFYEGHILFLKNNALPQDYGPTLITEHKLGEFTLYALYGHLSLESLSLRAEGERFLQGETLGFVGDKNINGGWNPHLHFQLSWQRPTTGDLPGAVNKKDLDLASKIFPDPRVILGPLY